MSFLDRKAFLRKIILSGLGYALLPKLAKGHPGEVFNGHHHPFNPYEVGIIDLHCHPSLKMYLWGRKLWRRHTPGAGMNAFDLQDDVDHLSAGTLSEEQGKVPDLVVHPEDQPEGLVRGLIVAHYLVEVSAEKQWDLLKKLYPWFARLFRGLAAKIEHGDRTNTDQIIEMIDELEWQVCVDKGKKRSLPFVIAKNYDDFKRAFDEKKFPIAHAIEGAHALGRNLPPPDNVSQKGRKRRPEPNNMRLAGQPDSQAYINNLIRLKDRGVCMMTLAHFFANDIAHCVEGISPDTKQSVGMKSTYVNTAPPPGPRPTDHFYDEPLTPIGVDVVNWMLNNGMIIDLTHSTPAIRKQVFAMNNKQCPIIFTHTGAMNVFNDHPYDANKYPDFGYYGVSDDDIHAICDCDGTIGIIPEVFWLAGGDTHLRSKGVPPKLYRNGIPYMLKTIKYINDRTPGRDFSHISIGTDFDGFADQPQDL